MRAFIGIELAEQMVAEVAALMERLKLDYHGWRWTKPANLHITLKFLGEVTNEQLDSLDRSLQTVALQHGKFSFSLGKLGCFPNYSAPKVLWLGVEKGSAQLVNLAETVATCCMKHGFSSDSKRFQPHLTIGRAGNGLKPLVPNNLKPQLQMETTVTKFILIESKLSPAGPSYFNRKLYFLNQ
ncbi:MAG TPA: RNA 2',3'-cyclic phosphodiesterase [Bacillota bacterium]|jgi:2'-5' RNA ligase|nr:RNA 2',3'-cyclic phosphodiesterase [Bacillota bacterium]HOL09463.1 RNA 2',3'-cyclic phosphodiesterase [Bacillota bacterium]HPO97685.1 RNA 2',3'-cyclic phosphodiesterase [Bacillota bacterium]